MTQLQDMQTEVMEFVKLKGWDNPGPTFGEAIALLHSEVSEALEAFRKWGLDDATHPYDLNFHNTPKPEGVGSEFADTLVRLLHYSAIFGVDLEMEFTRKMDYNSRRPYRHGNRAL